MVTRRSTVKSFITGQKPVQNYFPITTDELTGIHDPKSMLFFQKRFQNDAQNFYDALGTNKNSGLDPSLPDLDKRVNQFGANKLPERKPKSFFQLAWEAMHDQVLIILTVAAIVSLALGLYETFGQPPEHDEEGNEIPQVQWVDGVAIIAAVLIVVLVGAANDYQKELQFAKLNAKKNDREIIVVRGGQELVVSIYDLLVGDILNIQTGDIMPADAVLISGSCECDESALTGESNTIKKLPIETALAQYNEKFPDRDADIGTKGVPDAFLISGSTVLSGLGTCIVTAVGENSINGRTMMALKVEPEETPMQVRLNNLANGITKYGFLAAIILFIILFFRFIAKIVKGGDYYDLPGAEKGSRFLDILITAITIVVVAIPEGLPLAVTLALAFATTRMAKDANLVRVLRACEIMGGATAVCSDKTGTLTENRMRVVNGNISDKEFDDNTTSTISTSNELQLSEDTTCNVLTNIALNSTAFENNERDNPENPLLPPKKKHWWSKMKKGDEFGKPEPDAFLGSKTEVALLLLAEKSFGMTGSKNLATLRSNPSILGVESIAQVIPFESSRKWGGIVVKYPGENKYRLFVKGASELVFARCSTKTTSDGSMIPVDSSVDSQVSDKITAYAKMALRTISLAHRDFDVPSWPPKQFIGQNPAEADPNLLLGEPLDRSSNSEGLVLDGIVGIKDPLREGVREAVGQCKRAGVRVRMVTGDNVITAKAISVNAGIMSETDLDDPHACMEGPAFRKLTKSERNKIVPKLKVLARSSPEDKRILVETLKKQGEVVAVTGDGTNDAPALKLADVGFSMGIAGTEVAREASDIILMTDDFAAIVSAIKWGRCVSTSIKKFIQFQLTVNITAVVLTFVSALVDTDGHSVLTAVQLLWINLIMDTLAALALATDKPDDSVLDRKPEGRSKTLISVSMWKMIIGQASLQLIITFVLYFAGGKIFHGSDDITDHQQQQLNALTFNTFVWLQFFKLWVTRKLDEGDGIETVRGRMTANNLNFFEHFFRNWWFLGIAFIIAGAQVMIMFVGGTAFSIVRQTPAQWGVAIICGMLALPWGIVIRLIPDSWVIRIFPTRLYKVIAYVASFQFLRFGKKRRVYLEEEEEGLMYSKVPAFKKTRDDIIYVRGGDAEGSTLNPVNLYHRWRESFSHSESDIETGSTDFHALSALTMVPTVVGGAVAGWSPLASSAEKEN
ncbi:CYFA0S10e02256g1_1 [Cyberlindnera fabianii]|uniref:Calcium-transporting ATPase n=1 Tax=Cyberlindnera fabianii TaxID=36022 RepID=A0A061AZ03_CYBFA|nr:CYFA0S10e02256g1_1 [Cyberlindnera fabianii]